jgi:hypothetical protein
VSGNKSLEDDVILNYSRIRNGLCYVLRALLLLMATGQVFGNATLPGKISTGGGAISLGAPVVADWAEFRVLSGSIPVSGRGSAGSISFTAHTVVDFSKRTVALENITLGQVSNATPALERAVGDHLAESGATLGLDDLIGALPANFEVPQQAVAGPQLNFSPPRIVVSNRPMRLLLIDGPPAPVTIPATGIEFVVNTDWDVFHDKRGGAWYILDDGHWITNNFLSSGDWRRTAELPRDFLTLQVSSEWPQVAAAMPPVKSAEKPVPFTISYEPTELVVIDGEERLEAIGGAGLHYVANTESDLFIYGDRYYYLASGRWFYTKSLDRKWFAVKNLPDVFSEIPENHPRSRVLAAVPGTRAARQAMIEAAIPRTATVAIGTTSELEIPYLGEPSFVEIQGTPLRRAENTPFQVIRHNNFYYLCHEGAWYSSSQPQGPWDAARKVPEVIYSIPATDPAYNVTFVKLGSFDDSSGRAAYVSTSGYYSAYYTGNSIVYGTGWYYPGYYHGSAYWRYPYTYGRYGWHGGYYGASGPYWPHYNYHYSETVTVDRTETDWQWDLDGNKRRVYNYGPQNYVGGEYVRPKSNIYSSDGSN